LLSSELSEASGSEAKNYHNEKQLFHRILQAEGATKWPLL
jgi:hypothetical protein